MNNAVKRELSLIFGGLALGAEILGSPRWRRRLNLLSAGFFISSFGTNYSLRGKRAYITGGSRGLGLSLAWNLLDQGAAAVTLVARDQAELMRAKEILLLDFPEARVHMSLCDITQPSGVEQSLQHAIEAMGGLDILINNAGSILVAPFTSLTDEEFEAQMRLHFFSSLHTIKTVLPHFYQRGEGRILNICSLGGKAAIPHMLAYDASKFALAGLSQGLAAELARDGILVTAAYPTVMRTGSPMQAVFKGDHEKEHAWFKSLDVMPGLAMSADRAAKKILKGVVEGRSEILLSFSGKVRVGLGAFFPETVNLLMDLANRLLPDRDSSLRKTGAESSDAFDRNPLLKPLRKKATKAETEYNQVPLHDAEFNLGLKH